MQQQARNNAVSTTSALCISIQDDLKIFDALSPRLRAGLNQVPLKLSAAPRFLLLSDDAALDLVARTLNELTRLYPAIVPLQPLPAADPIALTAPLGATASPTAACTRTTPTA